MWLRISASMTASLAIVAVTAGLTFVLVFAQDGHALTGNSENATTTHNDQTSPLIYEIVDSNVEVKLSWVPEPISIDEQPTKFMIEFLDADTGQRLEDVSYSVHMAVDGKELGHGHESTAAGGIATIEQEFDSVGTLDMVIEIHSIGSDDVSQFAQFSIAVTPELPVAVIALAAGITLLTALSILKRSLL